jgi:site-specific DNA-adenine methylase
MSPDAGSHAAAPVITGLAPWFGSYRLHAEKPAALMGDCPFVCVLFAGSLCEVPHFRASTLLVNDKHADIITLARVVRDRRADLAELLEGRLFHPVELAGAQERMRAARAGGGLFGSFEHGSDVERAADYFTCAWMGRSALAGTPGELNSGLALRYDAGGGDSAKRYRSAVESLAAWEASLQRCSFACEDFRGVLARVSDAGGTGVYADPPFPEDGDAYLHAFSERDHRDLAGALGARARTRVVVRFHDHPWVRELYPEGDGVTHGTWVWHRFAGRDQNNQAEKEVLLVRGGGA